VAQGEGGQVEQGVALACLGPVDDAGDLVVLDEDVGDLQVSVDEGRRPRAECGLGDLAVALDQVGGKGAARDEPIAFAVEVRGDVVEVLSGPRRQRRVVELSPARLPPRCATTTPIPAAVAQASRTKRTSARKRVLRSSAADRGDRACEPERDAGAQLHRLTVTRAV